MEQFNWTKNDTLEAKQFWARYRQQHDVSNRTGQTAGIDPRQGRIGFGDSIRDGVSQRDEEGVNTPLFFVRVGSETYFQKGLFRLLCGQGFTGVRTLPP